MIARSAPTAILRRSKRLLVLALLALVASLCLLGPDRPASAADQPGELIVQPLLGISIDVINAKYGTRTLLSFTDSSQVLVASPTVAATLSALLLDKLLVAWVEPNARASEPRAMGEDSGADPYGMSMLLVDGAQRYRNQWGVPKVSLTLPPQIARGDGRVIGVLDTIVDATHPELAGKTLPSIDLGARAPQVNVSTIGRSRGHGTFVAGVALLAAPQAKVLPVRVLNEDGVGSVATVAEGIRRAAASGAAVINMSLSTDTRSRTLGDAVNYARRRGSVLVAAYGNEGRNAPAVYPADFSGVLSVAATDQYDRRASFSNYGRPAGTAAPGVDVVGPFVDHRYGIGSGTSFSTAWVSGQAAILLSAAVRQDQVASRIVTTADNISQANGGRDPGFGRINVFRSTSP